MSSGDLRYALRSLRNHPGFTAVAVASLALGIGVNTAIFSLVDQLLLASVPGRDPAHLVRVSGGRSGSYPFYREYRDRNTVFSEMFAGSYPQASGLRPEGAPAVEVGRVQYVTGNYFQGLGIGAAAGRVIAPYDDSKVGGSPVAVLTYAYWQRRYGGDFRAIGRKLAVNGHPVEIVGIAENGFNGTTGDLKVDALIPVTMFPVLTPSVAPVWDTPNMTWLIPMARLKPGGSIARAQAAMRVLYPQVFAAVNDAFVKSGGRERKFREDQVKLESGARPTASTQREMGDPLKILAIATGLVLLIACANVANLLLSRAAGRRREFAMRLALGSSRTRLVRQLLTESLVLAAAGGAVGLALAYLAVDALGRAEVMRAGLQFHPSLAVLAASAGITAVTVLLFGLVPALRATRIGLADAVKDGGAVTQGGGRLRLGKALVAGQVALTLALVAGAVLFARTLRNLTSTDLGFDREKVLIVDIDPTKLGYRDHRLRTFYDELLERARRVPGVRSAALLTMSPMGHYAMSRTFSAEGYQPKPGERLVAYSNPVSADSFRTLGTPMLLGRDFRPEDEPVVTPGGTLLAAIGHSGSGGGGQEPPNASGVCIIDEMLARHLFGEEGNPLGRHISYLDRYNPSHSLEIVGVVKNVHYGRVRKSDDFGAIYEPSWSNGAGSRMLALRLSGDTAPVMAGLRRELRALDADAPLLEVRSLEQYLNSSLERERLIALLSGFFGLLALGLAGVGLYGVTAYSVVQRTREVGIRMALGAQRGDVVRMIVRESAAPVLVGVVAGLGGAYALARVASGMLFGVAPNDPGAMLAAVGFLLAAAVGAAAIPARRASRVDPMTALRYE